MQQMGIAPGQPVVPGQVVVSLLLFIYYKNKMCKKYIHVSSHVLTIKTGVRAKDCMRGCCVMH